MELFSHQKEGVEFLKVRRGATGRVKEIRKCVLCKEPFNRHRGNIKAKYCSRKCACRDRNDTTHQKKAGKIGGSILGNKVRRTGTKGYVKVNQRHEHRIVAEKMIGRKLKKSEVVHHVNEDKHDNRPENLMVISRKKHAQIHLHGKHHKKS